MSETIIYVHNGSHQYFKNNLKHFQGTDSESHIYHIGDIDIQAKGVKFVSLNKLQNSNIKKFISSYIHMSTNSYEFELFCILRWIYIEELVRTKSIDEFFICDSDNLIFKKLVEIRKIIGDIDCGFFIDEQNKISCGHFSYFKKGPFSEFIKFILNFYTSSTYLKKIDNKFSFMKENQLEGGISDMDILFYFYERKRYSYNFKNLNQIFDNNYCFDLNFNRGDLMNIDFFNTKFNYFLLQKNKIINRDLSGNPVCKSINNKLYFLINMHFQGKAKLLLHRYVNFKLQNSHYLFNEAKIFLRLIKLILIKIKRINIG